MITERQKNILWAIVEDHIKMAEPVSSKALAQKRGFEIGAPMLRKEMNQLEKEGYLASPHTSAGRVPTDQAYRLYIQEHLAEKSGPDGLTPKESRKVKDSLTKNWNDESSLFKEISRVASELSRELGVAGHVGGEGAYSCGLANLFEEPELRSFDNLACLMRLMDNMDEYFDSLLKDFFRDDFGVSIGHENPFKEIGEFSVITGRYQLPHPFDGARGKRTAGFVSVIGPKRMNYRKNMAVVNYISKVINEN